MTDTASLLARQQAAVAPGAASRQIFAQRAENAELWDVTGRRFIDFAAGIAVVNTGHCHPGVVAAAKQQLEQFTHTCYHVAPYELYIQLAERLNAAAPGDFAKKSLLVTTGAEAVENAVKVARYYTGRSAVIAFNGGFHGRTSMGMALTGKVNPYKAGFGPLPSEVYHAPFPHPFQGVSVEDSLNALNQLFAADVDPKRVAAIIIEPIQGEGGFNVAPSEFMQSLRALCDQHGILMIADEVQTGMARTGKLFAMEHTGVAADIVTLAKGLAGGFPLSAVVGRADIMDAAHVGGLGGTYGGNPLAVAAANAVLDAIEKEELCQQAEQLGQRLHARLESMQQASNGRIGDLRGRGCMIAIELMDGDQPDAILTQAVVAQAEQRGLILLPCGTRGNVVRLLPPLTTPDAIADEAMDIMQAAFDTAVAAR